MRMIAFAAFAVALGYGGAVEAHSEAYGEAQGEARDGPRLEFRCELDSKEKGGECRAWGEFSLQSESARDYNAAELRVRCTDGFRLSDSRAEVEFQDYGEPKTFVTGRDGGNRATLAIVGGLLLRTVDFEAFLKIRRNGETRKYAGECRLRQVVGDLDDAGDAAE